MLIKLKFEIIRVRTVVNWNSHLESELKADMKLSLRKKEKVSFNKIFEAAIQG